MSQDNFNPTHKENWTLGAEKTIYKDTYDPSLLVPIERSLRREKFRHPMVGIDVWDCFEFSFLNMNGLPQYRVFRLETDANNPFIFESKSLKLYLNSFSNSKFENFKEVVKIIEDDLSKIAGGVVTLQKIGQFPLNTMNTFPEVYMRANVQFLHLESLLHETVCSKYEVDPSLLEEMDPVSESYLMCSDLLRSNCEITNQQDLARCWVFITPSNKTIEPRSLLRYIVSFRNHQEFHEPTCERIYQHLYDKFLPTELTVICQYTRRGGIGINPVRTNNPSRLTNLVLEKLLQQ